MGRTKTTSRSRTKPDLAIELREDIFRSGKKLRVDRDKGIVYEVKILGLESANGRRYLAEAARAAIGMYEGIGVYENHPKQPNDPRECDDRFGWLESVHVGEGGGLYGNLHILLPQSDLAKKIFKAAEEKPDLFGLSHNAKGEGKEVDGIFVIEQIVSVRSVDVVTEPATTSGLQEGVSMKTIKIKQLFENSWKKFARKTTKRPNLAKFMKQLVEEDKDELMDEDYEGEAPEDHEEALKGGFRASVAHIVDACLDGDEDPKECVQRIKELLTAHDKLTDGDDEPEDDMEEEEPEKKEKEPEKKEKEAEEQRRRYEKIERENLINKEARKAGVSLDDDLMESLMAMHDPRAIKKLIEREKGRKSASGSNSGPRSGADGGGSGGKQILETPEGVMATLMN